MNKKSTDVLITPTKLKFRLRSSRSTANFVTTDRYQNTELQSPSSNKTQTKVIKTNRYAYYTRKPKLDPLEDFDEIIKTPYDNELQKYKHKCKTPFYLRQERIQRFIFDKKSQNKLKYSAQSKINQTALPVPNGSVSIMLNVAKKDFGFNLQAFKKKIPTRSKYKMKWKTIQWLLKNRNDAIKQIFQNYHILKKFALNKKEGMNKDDFGVLLSFVGLGADQNLAEKLFYVFDEDGSGAVDYKELIVGLEVLKEDSLDEKLKVFIDLCDEDNSGKILEIDIFNILKQNILNSNDVHKLKVTFKTMVKDIGKMAGGYLDKELLIQAAKNNFTLRQLLEQTFQNVRRIDDIIENDLEEPFHQFVPISANFVNYREGIHYPTVDKIFDALQAIEKIDVHTKELRNTQTKQQRQQYRQYAGLLEKINEDEIDYK